MNRGIFESYLTDNPSAGTHVFITDREALGENIQSIGPWPLVILIKDQEGYFQNVDVLLEYLEQKIIGTYADKYIYVPMLKQKKDNEALENGLKDLGCIVREGWYLFHKKDWADRPEKRDRVHEEIKKYLEAGGFREIKVALPADKMQSMELPPINWIIKDLLPEGLAILSGPPKTYKSFMALDLGITIANGLQFLGFQTVKGGVLYYDLESTKRRPKDRMEKILQGNKAPSNFYFVTQDDKPGTMEDGFFENMKRQIEAYPDIKLIIVDVYQKIRGASKKGINFYEKDYEDGVKLQAFALEHHICILIIHHNSKKLFSDDPYSQMSGSTGLLGSVDTALVLTREKRFENNTKLSITGREIMPRELVLKFDDKVFKWILQGSVEEVEANKLVEEYHSSPIIGSIKKLVFTNGGEWSGTVSDLISASKYLKGCEIYDDAGQVGRNIQKFQPLLSLEGRISYEYDRKNKKREYRFFKDE